MEDTFTNPFTSGMTAKRHDRLEHQNNKKKVLEAQRIRLSVQQGNENKKKQKKSQEVDTEVTSAFALIQNLVSPSLEHNCVLKSTSKMNFAR